MEKCEDTLNSRNHKELRYITSNHCI